MVIYPACVPVKIAFIWHKKTLIFTMGAFKIVVVYLGCIFN